MQECIQECQGCANLCLSMATNHCLTMGGKHVEPEHFRTMLDCAQICQTSADFMLRGSALHGHTCRACAAVCEACAKSCQAIGDMRECVEMCRRCAEACRTMASAA